MSTTPSPAPDRHEPDADDRAADALERRDAQAGFTPAETATEAVAAMPPNFFVRMTDTDLFHSFIKSPVTVVAGIVTVVIILASFLSPWIAPYNPFDPASLNLMDGFTAPMAESFSGNVYWLGTDDQGRDIFSTILHGARISLIVGILSVLLAMAIGVTLGLVSGYFGGWIDSLIMRIADIFLTFPTILIALLVGGVVRGVLPRGLQDDLAMHVLIFAIAMGTWVSYARTVRGSTMVEKGKEYVQAARVIGIHPVMIMLRHILPNVMGPVLVIATIGLALAIITEATLSFLGVGMPPTQPSLGTLINTGNDFLFSGEWWITIFPGLALIALALSVNLLGDWLRDALNPKLR